MSSPDKIPPMLGEADLAEVAKALQTLETPIRAKFFGLLAVAGSFAEALVASPDYPGSKRSQTAKDQVEGSLLTGAANRLRIEDPHSEEAHDQVRQGLAEFMFAVDGLIS